VLAGPAVAAASGVSVWLPLHLEPELERQIEQVLILADQPVIARPIAVATVREALPKACAQDPALCREVKRYLERYAPGAGLTGQASVAGSVTSGADVTVPNRHGLNSRSEWEASAQLSWQPSEYALFSLGGVSYEDDSNWTGTLMSFGWDVAQLDIGWRDHWFSPLTDSAMLVATQAPTMPSVTLSNSRPMTRAGIRYELFVAEMSESDSIVYEDGLTSGNPQLLGARISIEPAPGWSLGLGRLMQYGGGERDDYSFGDVLEAFFNPSGADNVNPGDGDDDQFGNQLASITSRFIFPGALPFSVYAEYAGEDTSRGRNTLLGNSALSVGIDFPQLWRQFDFTFEVSEWQNAWYVSGIYGDGLTNDGIVIGHWGGDQRVFGDGIGAQTQMVRVGWWPDFGGVFDLQARTILNESYSTFDYDRGYDVSLRYSRPWRDFVLGAEVFAGRDVFGEDFSRVGAFVRYIPAGGAGLGTSPRTSPTRTRADGAELFVDLGVGISDIEIDLDDDIPIENRDGEVGGHFAIGARRAVSAHQDLGVRVEYDDVDGAALLGVRAVDYRYRFDNPFALTGFIGAARYDLATPAYGIYGGVGAQWRNLFPRTDLSLDVKYAYKVARDDLVDGDPFGNRPDSFYDILTAALYLSVKF
jgi:hypothetical protein